MLPKSHSNIGLDATQVTCPHCGGMAHLMRRSPDPRHSGGEIRTFECAACHRQTEMRTD